MSIRPYPAAWEKTIELTQFGTVQVRPVRPEDEMLYEHFFANVDSDDLQLRFFTAAPGRSHRFLARLTQNDYAREMAFVALSANGEELLGASRLAADPDNIRAEYAVMVRSDLKGKGLGWQLMQHLIAYARTEGIQELFGDVLAANVTMLEMCRELGFSVHYDPADETLRQVRLSLIETNT